MISIKNLSLQPQPNGNATVAYQLDGKYRVFNGAVAIMDGATLPTAVKFRVYADGKPIWSSRVLNRSGEAQTFTLRIAKAHGIQVADGHIARNGAVTQDARHLGAAGDASADRDVLRRL